MTGKSAIDIEQQRIAHLRHENTVALFRRFLEQEMAVGKQPAGIEQAFAQKLEISPSMWSMLKTGSRPVGNKMARQIEAHHELPAGWLDESHPESASDLVSPAEQQMQVLLLRAWRATNAAGRKNLKQLLRAIAEARIAPEDIGPRGR